MGGFGISRYVLDNNLAQLAKTNGVTLLENTKVNDIVFKEDVFYIDAVKKSTAKIVCASYGKRSNIDIKWRRPFTCLIFTNAYVKKIIVTEPAISRANKVGALDAIISPRMINSKYSTTKILFPMKPNSSEYTAKIKSVVRSGINSKCAWVPLSKPLPVMPPEPTAIVD